MAWLVDTNVLVRLANADDVRHAAASDAVVALHRRGEVLRTAPQNLIEFRNCATRPVSLNGLGLSSAEAEAKAEEFESLFSLIPETPDIYPAWKLLARASRVTGKQVHDVRLIAVCQIHGITQVLTFNAQHLARFAEAVAGLVVAEPADVVKSGS